MSSSNQADAKFVITADDKASPVLEKLKGAFGGIESHLDEINKFKGATGPLLALGVGVGALGLFAEQLKTVREQLDALDESAQAVGTTAVALQELRNGAVTAGVGADDLEKALTKLSVKIAEAASGNAQASALFDALGVSVKDSNGNIRDTDKILQDIAGSFTTYRDGANKTALAIDLFGKAGAKMVPYLNQGSDGLKRATAVTEEFVRAASDLADHADLTRQRFAEWRIEIAGPFLVALRDATAQVNAMTGAGASVFDAWGTMLRKVFGQDTARQVADVNNEIATLESRLATLALAKADGRISRSDELAIDGLVKRVNLDYERLKQLDKLRIAEGNLTDEERKGLELIQTIQRFKGKQAPTVARGEKVSNTDTETELKRLQDEIDKTDELTASQKLLEDLSRGRYANATKDQLAQLDALTKQVDKNHELAKAEKDRIAQVVESGRKEEEANAAVDAELERGFKRIDDLTGRSPLKEYAADQNLLTRAFEQGSLSVDEYAKGLIKIKENLDNATKGAGDSQEILKDLGTSFNTMFEDLFVGGKNAGDVFKNLEQEILHMVMRMGVIKPLMESLFGDGKTGSGSLGSLFSSGASMFSSFFGGTHAGGGPVDAGATYLVGERGPELFTAPTAGQIVPNNALGGGGVHITQHITVGSNVSRTEMAQAMFAAKESAKAEIMESMRRGGPMAYH